MATSKHVTLAAATASADIEIEAGDGPIAIINHSSAPVYVLMTFGGTTSPANPVAAADNTTVIPASSYRTFTPRGIARIRAISTPGGDISVERAPHNFLRT